MNFAESRGALIQDTGILSEQPSYIVNGEEPQRIRVRVKRRRSKRKSKKKLYVLLSIFLCMFVGGSVLGVVEYLAYADMSHKDTALAQTGAAHLEKAQALLVSLQKNPLNAQVVNQARQEFAAALPAFVQVNNDLKLFIPVYGVRLSAALHLAPVAIELSQAGVAGCDILHLLIMRFHNPLNVQQSQGLTMADLAIIGQDFQQIKKAFNQAVDETNQVNPVDLQFDPYLGKLFATFQQELPALQAWLDEIDKVLPVLPAVLGIGTPTNYLVEVLDSTELRPGGGFIGNYGIATVSGGRLLTAHITDVYLLDRPLEGNGYKPIPLPAAYTWFKTVARAWSLRDSNLDADFPTAARYGEQNYVLEGGNVPVQGVIAITPFLIKHALDITGPISVPEYNEIINSRNVIGRIHFHQLGGKAAGEGSDQIPSPDAHSSLRKRFTELLAEHFLARVRQLSPAAFAQLTQLMMNSVRTKDIQLYFNSSVAEHLLQRFHLDAAIQALAGDSLFVVDANIAGNKANSFIINTLNDQVNIDAAGNVTHHTTLTYAWTLRGLDYGNQIYEDYLRVYVPPGSTLQMQDGWQPRGISQAFNREVWAGFFTLTYKQTRTITLAWTEPNVVGKDASGWHYHYLIQKQAGIQRMLHLQVTLPSCAVMAATAGGLVAGDRHTATLAQYLSENTNVGIDYNCP